MNTRLIKFALLMMATLLTAIVAKADCCDQVSAKRDSILSLISGAKIPDKSIKITSFGAKGNGTTDCKPAFDKAMKRAAKVGGLHIVVPKGTYLLRGPIHLVSNVCIELQEGATLRFDATPELYLPMVKTGWEGTFVQNYSPFIYGYQLENVSIIGKGTIDGNADDTFAKWKPQQRPGLQLSRDMNHNHTPVAERNFGEGYYLRPHLIQFFRCKGVTVEGVFITNSPFWCVHLLASENVICRGLRYDAKLVNNDGIDPEYARNVLIENIDFNNGDDNVAIKSGRDDDGRAEASPSSGIIIRNCRFKGLHGVVLGSEMSSGVENVFIEDCTYAGYCKRGIYVKTNPDRGGFIRNIYVNNCAFDEVEDLFYITSKYAGEGQDNNHYTVIENIHVKNLTCHKARKNAIVLQGTKQEPIRNVSFECVNVDEAGVGISMSDAKAITLTDCNLGGYVDVPTQITKTDKIFDGDKK
jgi:polygalacturonase